MKTVITYQAPSGETIHLTPTQIARLEKAGVWPRNHRGEEFCTVSVGQHYGNSTWSDEELAAEMGLAAAKQEGQK